MAEKDKKCSKREKVLCRKENEKETKGDMEVGRKVKVSGKKELKLCKEKKLYERKSGIQRIKKVKVGKGKNEYEGGKKERLGRKENERECMKEREWNKGEEGRNEKKWWKESIEKERIIKKGGGKQSICPFLKIKLLYLTLYSESI